MTDTQLALIISKYLNQLELCIQLSRSELEAINNNKDATHDVDGLVDEQASMFRKDEADKPAIPALYPFEELRNLIAQDIGALTNQE